MKKGEVELYDRIVETLGLDGEQVLRMNFVEIMERLVTKLEEQRDRVCGDIRYTPQYTNVDDDKIMVLDDVLYERFSQIRKWGKQRHEYGKWLAILMEEVGEVAEAIGPLIGLKSGKESDSDDLYVELIQVAAVACAIAEQVTEERFRRFGE